MCASTMSGMNKCGKNDKLPRFGFLFVKDNADDFAIARICPLVDPVADGLSVLKRRRLLVE